MAAEKQVAWRNVQLLGERYLVPRYHYDSEGDSLPEHELVQGARFATLGELVKEKIVSIRKGHEVGSDAYGTGEIPFVRTSDLSNSPRAKIFETGEPLESSVGAGKEMG